MRGKITSYFLLSFLSLCFSANAQYAIKGRVIIEGEEKSEAQVILLTKAKTIETVIETRDGVFAFSDIKKGSTHYAVAARVGYLPDTVRIESITQDIDVGTLFLRAQTTILEEVTVEGSSMTIKDGIKRIVPTDFHRKNSTDALVMLDKMNLSRINVDPISKSLKLNGGGAVKLYLNGREVGINEISALSPEVIRRVEYHDIPEAKYSNADVVLDFITKQDEMGGRVYLSLWQGLYTAFGEDNVSLKFNRGASQFSLDYYLAYRDWKHLSRTYEETFFLPDKTVSREEVGLPGHFRYNNHDLRLNYNYLKEGFQVNVTGGVSIHNSPYEEWQSILHYEDRTLTLYDNSDARTLSPFAQIYFRIPLGEKRLLLTSISGRYARDRNYRVYSETGAKVDNAFENSVTGGQKSFAASALYEHRFESETWITGADFNRQVLRNHYTSSGTGTFPDFRSVMQLSNLYLYSQFGRNVGRLYYRAGIGANQRWMNADGTENNTFTLRPSLSLRYNFSDNSDLSYYGSVSNAMPSFADLTDVTREIDFIQVRRGNPALKPQIDYYNALVFNHRFKRTACALYLNHTYSHNPIMESTFIEDGRVVRTQENHKSFQQLTAELEYGGSLFNDHLSFKAFAGIKCYISNGNSYNHKKVIPYYGGRITAYYKSFVLSWNLSRHTGDNFWGETLNRSEDGHMFSIGYRTNSFGVSVDALNLFTVQHIGARENYSAVAPYKRYEYLDEIKNLIRVNLTLNLSYGKSYNDKKKLLDDTTVTGSSAIVTGKK